MPVIRELTNLVATHVSYVRKGANKKQFFLMKSDEGDLPDFEKKFDIFINKADDEKKLVYGVVYEPDEIDIQGEFARAEEIEKAAHQFLADCRNIDLQHNFQPGFGTVVESYVAPANFTIGAQQVKKGAWVLVTKASDDVWGEIKKGEITGYSMAGKAVRKEVVKKEAVDGSEKDVGGFFNAMKAFFNGTSVEKSGRAISGVNMREIKAAHAALSRLLSLDVAEDAKEDDNSEGDDEMKKEEMFEIMKSAVEESVKPLDKRIAAMEKQISTAEQKEPENNDIAGMLKTAIDEALNPLAGRLTALERVRGISNQIAEKQEEQTNVSKSVFAGLPF